MTISSTTTKNTYTGNAATSSYSYSFKIFNQTELEVAVRDTDDVETTLAITTDYTVTGAGNTNGGSIALVSSGQAWLTGGNLKNNYILTIKRVLPITQLTDFRNQGDFYPEGHENQFDKLIMINLQQQDSIDKSVKLSATVDDSDFDPTLPATISDAASANKTIVVNATYDGFDMGPTSDEISNAQTYATNAATSADTAEDWATKTDGAVSGGEYSAKAYAIGGTGITDTASKGAAKEWAIETASTVDGTNYSAKEHAIGTQIRGIASGGSAKDWATYTGGTVDNASYSAKYHADAASTSANSAAVSAAAAATSAAASQWNDVAYKVFADSPISVVDADAGTLFAIDCTNGNVVVNLPAISGLTLSGAWSVAFKKTDNSSNTITINRNGTDTIEGGTSATVTEEDEGLVFIPDTDGSPDNWTTTAFGFTTAIRTAINAKLNTTITTTGDLIYSSSGTTASRLAIGSTNQYLQVIGGVPAWASAINSVRAVTTTDTALTTDGTILASTTGGSYTLTVYTAVGNLGRRLKVIKTTSDYNVLTLSGTGLTTMTLINQGESVSFISDNTNWIVENIFMQGTLETKYLSADFSTNAAEITDITFDNLIIGRTYTLIGNIYFNKDSADATASVLIYNNTSGTSDQVGTAYAGDANTSTNDKATYHTSVSSFVAVSTKVRFVTSGFAAGTNLFGSGTAGNTFATLIEQPYIKATTRF